MSRYMIKSGTPHDCTIWIFKHPDGILKRRSMLCVKRLCIVYGNHECGFEFHAEQYHNCLTQYNKFKTLFKL